MNHTTRMFSRRAGEHRPCDALSAIALHRYTPPLSQRLFFAFLRWGWVAVLAAVFLLTGCDSAAAVSVAAQEADSRRDVAAQAMCGPGAVVQWLDASTAECIKEAGHAAARP